MSDLLFSPIRLSELELLIQNSVEKAFKNFNSETISNKDSKFLSKKESAELLGISQSMINKLMASGKLNFSKIGKKVVFDIEDLKKLLDH